MSFRKGYKIMKILEAIPDDSWFRASDIKEKTGLNAHEIGGIISDNLLHDVIERRSVRFNGGHCYEYRCLRRMRG